jgi:hypothetical protein
VDLRRVLLVEERFCRARAVGVATVTGAPKNNPSGEKRTALVGCNWPWDSRTSVSGVIVMVVTNGAAPAGTDSVHRTPEASVTLSVDATLGSSRLGKPPTATNAG